jgi:hypothetical protein
MLQERVIICTRHGEILRRLDFQLQELLGFTTVIFPYSHQKELHSLTGLIIERFADPIQRIETGKTLYQLLFQNPTVFEGAEQFAKMMHHTGSRADYWNTVFTSCSPIGTEARDYSPTLAKAWSDHPVFLLSQRDWFTKDSYIEELQFLPIVKKVDLTNRVLVNVKYLKAINELKSFI